MKKLLIFSFALLLFQLQSFGQIVVSSCTAPDSIVAKYKNDIDAIVLKRTIQFNTNYKDSVSFDPLYADTVRRAIMAVYNAQGLPGRDSIFDVLKIHTHYDFPLNYISIDADSSHPWMQQLLNNIIPSGYALLDSLLDKYHLHIDSATFNHPHPNEVDFVADSNWNVIALSNLFKSIPGINDAWPTYFYSLERNSIGIISGSGYVKIYFDYRYEKEWVYKVYDDCSVEYIPDTSVPNPTSVKEVKVDTISIVPNPVADYLRIISKEAVQTYRIYGMDGRQLMEGKVEGDKINVQSLPKGNYVIRFTTNKGNGNLHFVKQ